MTELEFTKQYSVDIEKIMQIITDHDVVLKLLPPQFAGNILEKTVDSVLVEETINISLIKSKIVQRTIYKKINSNLFEIRIISGPAKDSTVKILMDGINRTTKITIKADLKLGLKYKILMSFIKKRYYLIIEQFLDGVVSLALLTEGRNWRDSIIENGQTLILSEKYLSLKFAGWWYGDLKHVFVEEVYKELPFFNKIVIDVGANIADSSIYFAMNGAKKVIALEPFPKNFQIGKKNIVNNNLESKVFFMLAGCSDKVSHIPINKENFGTSSKLETFVGGTEIETKTLETILDEFNIEAAVLKLDCEGCEYSSILTSAVSTLRKFEAIYIEYHSGYRNLTEKLQSSGFKVIVNENTRKEYPNKGHLLAIRQNKNS